MFSCYCKDVILCYICDKPPPPKYPRYGHGHGYGHPGRRGGYAKLKVSPKPHHAVSPYIQECLLKHL